MERGRERGVTALRDPLGRRCRWRGAGGQAADRPLPQVPALLRGGRLRKAGLSQVAAHEEQFGGFESFEQSPRL